MKNIKVDSTIEIVIEGVLHILNKNEAEQLLHELQNALNKNIIYTTRKDQHYGWNFWHTTPTTGL